MNPAIHPNQPSAIPPRNDKLFAEIPQIQLKFYFITFKIHAATFSGESRKKFLKENHRELLKETRKEIRLKFLEELQ